MKTYYVYIMASASRVLYTGVTNSIERRVAEHQDGRVPGFSARYNVRELVYLEPFGDIRAAIGREKEIKGWLRAKKIALIESRNPHWEDLAWQWRATAEGSPKRAPGKVTLSAATNSSGEILRSTKRNSE